MKYFPFFFSFKKTNFHSPWAIQKQAQKGNLLEGSGIIQIRPHYLGGILCETSKMLSNGKGWEGTA